MSQLLPLTQGGKVALGLAATFVAYKMFSRRSASSESSSAVSRTSYPHYNVGGVEYPMPPPTRKGMVERAADATAVVATHGKAAVKDVAKAAGEVADVLVSHTKEATRDIAQMGGEMGKAAVGKAPPVVQVRETPTVTHTVEDRVKAVPLKTRAEEPMITSYPGMPPLPASPSNQQQQHVPHSYVHASPAHIPAPQAVVGGQSLPAQAEPHGLQLKLQFQQPQQQQQQAAEPQGQWTQPYKAETAEDAYAKRMGQLYQTPPQTSAKGPTDAAKDKASELMERAKASATDVSERAKATAGQYVQQAKEAAGEGADVSRAVSGVASAHAQAAGQDVKQASTELGTIGRTHAELAQRDVISMGQEVKQALKGEALPAAATVRQTPDLTSQRAADVVKQVPTGAAPEAVSGARPPSMTQRVATAGTIVKEHVKEAAKDVGQAASEAAAVTKQHVVQAGRDLSTAGGEAKQAVKGTPPAEVTLHPTPKQVPSAPVSAPPSSQAQMSTDASSGAGGGGQFNPYTAATEFSIRKPIQ